MTNEEAAEFNLENAKRNGNKLAFPIDETNPFHHGLNKREYMATHILTGLLSQNIVDVNLAVKLTDELLIELNRNK
jgi:hypothetical protein